LRKEIEKQARQEIEDLKKELTDLKKKVNSNSDSSHSVSHIRDVGNGKIQLESQQSLSQDQSISSDISRSKLGLTGSGATPVSVQDVKLDVDAFREILDSLLHDIEQMKVNIEQIKGSDPSSNYTRKSSLNPLSLFRSTAPQPSTTVSTRSYSPSTSVEEWLRDVNLEEYSSYFRDALGLVTLKQLAVYKNKPLSTLEKDWEEFNIKVPKAHRNTLVRELTNLVIS
jgi:hypothetical protein